MIKDWFRRSFGYMAYFDNTGRYNWLLPLYTPLRRYTTDYRPKRLPLAGSMRDKAIEERIKFPFRRHMKFPTPKSEQEKILTKQRWQYRRKHELGLELWLRLVPWYGYYPKKYELEEFSPVPNTYANPVFIEWMMGYPTHWTEIRQNLKKPLNKPYIVPNR